MTDDGSATVPAGWYPDPHVPAQLRWWTGDTWSEHTAAATGSEAAPAGAGAVSSVSAAMPAAAAASTAEQPVLLTRRALREAENAAAGVAPHMASGTANSASTPPVAEATLSLAEGTISLPEPTAPGATAEADRVAAQGTSSTGRTGAMRTPALVRREAETLDADELHDDVRAEALLAQVENLDAEPGMPMLSRREASERWYELVSAAPRWRTGSAWALAATPWILLFAFAAIIVQTLTGQASLWVVLACIALPMLWALAFAERDRRRLSEWGHAKPASTAWIMLGPFAYLIARMVSVRRQGGKGAAPLVGLVANVAVIGVLVGGAIFTLPHWWSPQAAELALEASLLSEGQPLDVRCPATADVSPGSQFSCAIADDYGTTGRVVVKMLGLEGDFRYTLELGNPAAFSAVTP